VVGTAALGFWALAGAGYTLGREPIASRYQLITATFLILVAAELFRPVRLRPSALLGIVAAAAFAVGANIAALHGGYEFLRADAAVAQADLGALEIARATVPAELRLTEPVAGSPYLYGVTAGSYFREAAAHGTPASSAAEIAAATPAARQGADGVMAAAYGFALVRARPQAGLGSAPGCRRLAPATAGRSELRLPRRGAEIVNLGSMPADLSVRRFAPPALARGIGTLAGGSAADLPLAGDRVRRPWRLLASPGSTIAVCPR
jgi:hypothetical protein